MRFYIVGGRRERSFLPVARRRERRRFQEMEEQGRGARAELFSSK
jgi:hypothetical protein